MRRGLHVFYAVAVAATSATGLAGQSREPADLVNQARKLNNEGKQDDALALYRQALARSPESFDAHYGAGIVLDLKGAFAEARREFARAIEVASADDKVQALTGMAVSFAFTGDAANCARFYQQIFDSQTAAGEFAGAAETANALGRVYLENGDLRNAVKWYQTGHETVRRQPDVPGPQLDLADLRWAHAQARIAARRGDAAEARRQIAVVQMLIDKGTNAEQTLQLPYLVGYVDLYLKNYKAAIAELQRADQTDPFILVLLGQAYEKARQRANAREAYQSVLMLNGHSLNNAFARPIARRKLGQKIE
jgi:tetratricopeptide (TPR) repeat protein